MKQNPSVKASKRQISCHQSKHRSLFRKLPLTSRPSPESGERGTVQTNIVNDDGSHHGCFNDTLLDKQANISVLDSLRRNYSHRGLALFKKSSDDKRTDSIADQAPMPTDDDCSGRGNALCNSCRKVSPGSKMSVCLPLVAPRTCPLNVSLSRRTVAPLKFDSSTLDMDCTEDTDDETISCDSSDDAYSESKSSRSGRKYRIRFHSYVKVVEIPDRNAYTSKQKRRMWNGNEAIRENAKRNKVEYEWEGWEWQNVIEEDEFCFVDGQLLHPAHAS